MEINRSVDVSEIEGFSNGNPKPAYNAGIDTKLNPS